MPREFGMGEEIVRRGDCSQPLVPPELYHGEWKASAPPQYVGISHTLSLRGPSTLGSPLPAVRGLILCSPRHPQGPARSKELLLKTILGSFHKGTLFSGL